MKEKLIAWLKTRRYNSFVLYVVVGGYLMYLAYKLLRGEGSAGSWAFGAAAVLFSLVGLLLVSVSLLAMYKGWFIERVTAESEREDEDGQS